MYPFVSYSIPTLSGSTDYNVQIIAGYYKQSSNDLASVSRVR